MTTAVLTGDREATVRRIADQAGIDTVEADVRPERKAEVIRERQRRGECVAMAGDNINDTPALMQADVGIAIHALEHGLVVVYYDEPEIQSFEHAQTVERRSRRPPVRPDRRSSRKGSGRKWT